MKKNNTNLILIISILLFLGVLGGTVYFFKIIKNKNRHISATVNTLENKIKEKENIDVLEKKMAELGDTHKRIGSYLVDTTRIDTFVEYLEKLGTDHNVILLVKSVEVPKGEKNKLTVSIDLKGSFSDVTNIIDLLENAPYNIVLNSLSLNKVTRQEEGEEADSKNKELLPKSKFYWQANVSFNVLSI